MQLTTSVIFNYVAQWQVHLFYCVTPSVSISRLLLSCQTLKSLNSLFSLPLFQNPANLLFSPSMNGIILVGKIPGKQNHIVFAWFISLRKVPFKVYLCWSMCQDFGSLWMSKDSLLCVDIAYFLGLVGYRWVFGQLPLSGFDSSGQPYIQSCEWRHTLFHSGCTILGSCGCSTRVLSFP